MPSAVDSDYRLRVSWTRSLIIALALLIGACNGADPDPVTIFEHDNKALTQLPTEAGQLKFMVLGDWGRRGYYHQTEVARQMGSVSAEVDVDFIATVGDNFYPSGVSSIGDSHWRASFEDVYNHPALRVPWHPTLGNHDYRGEVFAQIAYSEVSDRWDMPSRYYSLTYDINDTTQALLLFLDTPLLVPERADAVPDQQARSERQYRWIDQTLANSDAQWKIAVGHHPLYSAGKHGNDELLIERLQPIFEEHGLQIYIAGHDHNLQYLEKEDFDQVVSGGGSQLRKVGTNPLAVFTTTRPGFSLVTVASEHVLVQLIDHRGNILYGEVIEYPMRNETVPEPLEADNM